MSNYRNDQTERLAGMFKALSNPNRLRIFQRLASCCKPGTRCTTDAAMSSCVGELGKDLKIAPSTLSHHVKELHQGGLIRTERRGQHVECWVDPEAFRMLAEFFRQAGARPGAVA